MSPQVESLLGGNVAGCVVRIGSTVRKPATVATPAVHSLLAHLQRSGFDGSPRALGIDDLGRQTLEFVPGRMWDRQQQNTLADFWKVGSLIRSLHDATASFACPGLAEWDALSVPDGHELICHNDLAPWNLICRANSWVFVDWDNAAPGTRLWDLAWAAISFPPVEPDGNLPEAATAIRTIFDGYRLHSSKYDHLLHLMVRRARAASDLLIQGVKTGQQPWARLYAEGHHKYWGPVSGYIERNLSVLSKHILSLR